MTADLDVVPVNRPLFDGNERRYVLEVLEHGWLSGEGPAVERFENAFAASVGRKHAIAVSSGTAALEVALHALGVGPGDEVILPSFTIISCAAAILRVGATPVVVDADARTWNMDVARVESRVTAKTRAILAVHTYGLPVDMDPLLTLAERTGIPVVEDGAQAHGLTYRGRPCGSLGAVAAFSFYANKLVGAGEGGAVTTDSDEIAATCRSFRNLCFQRERRFLHEEVGWNYRMPALSAAVGLAQLERATAFLERKKRMGRAYSEGLSAVDALELPAARTDFAENGHWVYGVLLRDASAWTIETAAAALLGEGVETRPFFWALHEQPALLKRGLFRGERHPVSERLARRGFYLPSGNGLREDEIERVVRAVKKVFSQKAG